MYKFVLLLIFLGLLTPLLNTKVVDEKKALGKGIKPLFKVGADNDNAEEVVDFWDFNPSPNAKSAKKIISNVIKAAKAVNNSVNKKTASPVYKGYTSKVEKNELKEINQLLKDMDRILGLKKAPARRLEQVPEGNAEEGLQSQEEVIVAGTTDAVPENTQAGNNASPVEDNAGTPAPTTVVEGNTGSTPAPTTGSEGDIESEDATTDATIDTLTTTHAVSDTVSEGMATVAFTGTLRYDTDFDAFQDKNGKQVFIDTLSKTLEIDQNRIRIISLKRGSVIIDFEIANTAVDSESTDAAVQDMADLSSKLSSAIQKGDMKIFNADITNYTPKVLVYRPVTTKNPVSGRYYVMGAALLVTILMTSALVWFLFRNRAANEPKLLSGQRYKLANIPESNIEFADLEDGRQENPASNSSSSNNSIKMYAASPYSAEQAGQGNSRNLNRSLGKAKIN